MTELTRTDALAILNYKRNATPDELQAILARAEEFELRAWQKDQIGVQLTDIMAAKHRGARGIREDTTPPFLASLGVQETPLGLLHDALWFTSELRTGTRAIASCRNHRTPLCGCWRPSRDRLYAVRQAYGEKSPESWAALRTWEALEEIETSRPRAAVTGQATDVITGGWDH